VTTDGARQDATRRRGDARVRRTGRRASTLSTREFFGSGVRGTRVGERIDRGRGGEFADADADAGGEEERDVGEGSDRVVA
jgi:hypothetical protein